MMMVAFWQSCFTKEPFLLPRCVNCATQMCEKSEQLKNQKNKN